MSSRSSVMTRSFGGGPLSSWDNLTRVGRDRRKWQVERGQSEGRRMRIVICRGGCHRRRNDDIRYNSRAVMAVRARLATWRSRLAGCAMVRRLVRAASLSLHRLLNAARTTPALAMTDGFKMTRAPAAGERAAIEYSQRHHRPDECRPGMIADASR